MSKTKQHKQIRSTKGDALVKHGKPIGFYRGTEPNCRYCEFVLPYHTFECKHPDNCGENYDCHEYTEVCTELEWSVCPLNPKNKDTFENHIIQAFKNLGKIDSVTIEELWVSFHELDPKTSLAMFKIKLLRLHNGNYEKFEMSRGPAHLNRKTRFHIIGNAGLLTGFKINFDRRNER